MKKKMNLSETLQEVREEREEIRKEMEAIRKKLRLIADKLTVEDKMTDLVWKADYCLYRALQRG